MAGMACVCSPDTLQATCDLPQHSTAELLLAALLVLAGMLVWRVERCCMDEDGDSDGEEEIPPEGMFT